MHFISSNLLHDFPDDKYMLFYLLKKIHVKITDQLTRPNMQPDWLEPFLTHLKWPVFDAQPVWLATWLTRPDPNILFCHVYWGWATQHSLTKAHPFELKTSYWYVYT